MKNKYINIVEKLLFFIPFVIFVLYTSVPFVFAIRSNSKIISFIIKIFNYMFMKGPYVFIFICIVLLIYIFLKGEKKQKIITVITIMGTLFMCLNLINIEINFLTTLLFVSSYLIGIFYSISLFIYFKNKKVIDIKDKIIKALKFIVNYIFIIFILSIISNTSQYSYYNADQGLTGWFKSTNGLGHALVFLLPLFILFYIKNKKNKYLYYIIVISFLDLLIGTKACYYGLISTLLVSIIYLSIDYFKYKKYHYFKLVSLIIIFLMTLLISKNIYISEHIKNSLKTNTNEKNQVDIINFTISNRDENLYIIKPYFNESNVTTKVFGLGIYYPRFDFIYIELDLYDLLYNRGIYGFLLYLGFFGYIIINLFIKLYKNFKKLNIDVLFMFLTLGYIMFAAIFVGHVLFNLMALTLAILVMNYYYFIINKKIKK